MCTDDSNENFAGDPSEPTEPRAEAAPDSPASGPSDLAPTPPKHGWGRRRFLQAAALGTAAAALINVRDGEGLRGLRLGPSSALANDLSGLPCTAQDVRINGSGIVLNEPCVCAPGGTFTATVQFSVTNNASAPRYCVALHLNNGTDIILHAGSLTGSSTIPGKSTINMVGTLGNFPCNGGLVCFGIPLSESFTGKCLPGTCSTLAWNTSPGAAGCTSADQSPSGGQCRHQQICIQGFGATLACLDANQTGGSTCTPTCGGTTVLTATVSAAAVTSGTPFTYTLTGTDGSSQSFGPTAATSHNFTVTAPTGSTTYTITVCDSRQANCCRSASVTLTNSAIDKPVLTAGTADCSGSATFTVTNCDSTLTYTYQEVNCSTGAAIGSPFGSGCSATHTFTQNGLDHCVVVTASNGITACNQTSLPATVHINAPPSVGLTLSGAGNCNGQLTFTATASGGSGGFTYTFYKNGTQVQSGASNTLSYGPTLDGVCYAFTVKVTDSAGCVSPLSLPISVSQCVATAQGTGC